MARLPKSLVAALALALVLASVLAVAPRAAAAQNRPTWTQGDFWVYTRTAGGATTTVRVDVNERTTLTLTSGTYSVWHLTTTTTDAGGNTTVRHSWVVDSNLGTAKANFTVPLIGDVQVTFDPPRANAVFPLTTGAQWSLNTTVRVVGISLSFNLAYSGSVLAEQSTTVAAGTFSVAVIRNPSTGTAHEEDHYSDGAGNYVKMESFDGSGNRVAEQELTSYRYQSGFVGLLLIIGVAVGLAAIAIVAFVVVRRRRRARTPPGMGPAPPPQAPGS
jgi:hypothetical protein